MVRSTTRRLLEQVPKSLPQPVSQRLSNADSFLRKSRQVATNDTRVAREHIAKLTNGACAFVARQGHESFQYASAQARIGHSSVQVLRWDGDAECETKMLRSLNRHLIMHMPLSGEFVAMERERQIRVMPGYALLIGPGALTRRRWRGPCDLLNIVIDLSALTLLLTGQYAESLAPISDVPAVLLDLTKAPVFASYIDTIVADIANGDASMFTKPTIARTAEHLLLLLLCHSVPDEYHEALFGRPLRPAPPYVRRAEAFMNDHASEKFDLQAVTAAAGVSIRSLYYGFRTFRNTTPMQFWKQKRMNVARTRLLSSRSKSCLISEIARGLGYRTVGQFSRDYNLAFGETPRQTVRGAMIAPWSRHLTDP